MRERIALLPDASLTLHGYYSPALPFQFETRKPYRAGRTHAAERTNSYRRRSGSRRNKRTGETAGTQQLAAFRQKIGTELREQFWQYMEQLVVHGKRSGRPRGILGTTSGLNA